MDTDKTQDNNQNNTMTDKQNSTISQGKSMSKGKSMPKGGNAGSNGGKTKKKSSGFKSLDRRTSMILIAIAVLLVGLITGLILVRQPQTTVNEAQEPEAGPSCPLDAFRCTWEKQEGVTYECIIEEVTQNGNIEVARPTVGEDPETGKGLCTYTPEADKTYSCTVNATLEPGCTATDTAEGLCSSVPITATPTPTLTPTPTPNPACYITECDPEVENVCDGLGLPEHSCIDTDPSDTSENYRCVLNEQCVDAPEDNPESCWCFAPTATPTPTMTPTLTPTITPTPNPSATVTPTPSPTDIIVVNNTPTPTDTPVEGVSPTATPAPTLPVAGLPQATYLILLVGIVVIGIGLAL